MIGIEADVSEEWDSNIDWCALAERAVRSAVENSRYRALNASAPIFEISLKLTDNAEVQALNAAWRGKDKPTNVLSFPMIEPDLLETLIVPGASGDAGDTLLGDIVVAHEVSAAEAEAKGVSIETHAAHLVVHGVLHLLGYDHVVDDEQAEAMEAIERTALAAIGISDPYLVTEAHS